jgi:hypothetical protein
MRRVLLLAVATAVILPFHARAQGKPDFSGTWTRDAAKSDQPVGRGGRGGGAAVDSLTITQTPAQLTEKRGELTLVYKLDGSASTNQMPSRGGPMEVKSTAKWDGSRLVIESIRDLQGISITQKETRSLSADGKEMTIEQAIATPQGERTTKQVFTKS